jgi:MerR family transcriptional regulator, light-induced transcriptional regulator
VTETAQELVDALLAFDADRSHALLDRQLVEHTPDAVLAELVLPALREIGDRWECGDASVAQEHFASNLLRATLLSVARRWDMGRGRRALLACAPGELHDLPLIAFGVALHRRGWRILFLGTDTPLEMVASAANALGPDLVVVSSSVERDVSAEELAPLAAGRRLLLGGTWPRLDALDAERVGGDPVAAAAAVSG